MAAPAFAVAYNGRVLAARQAADLHPTASTIKVLTALALLQGGPPLTRTLVVTPAQAEAAAAGARLGHGELPLYPGERLTVRDLLIAMLLPSADDAADMLASLAPGGRRGLLRRMQRMARGLGIGLPPLGDPSGLSSLDRLSPLGELRLAQAALRSPVLARIVRSRVARLSQGESVRSLNRLLWSYPGAIGVKTGETAPAGYVLLFAARRTGTVLGVVMGEAADSARWRDARELLDWAFAWAKRATLPAGSTVARIVWPGGAVQPLRTAVPLLVPAGGTPRLHLSGPAALARGGAVGYAVLGNGRAVVVAPPAPLWLRLWAVLAGR